MDTFSSMTELVGSLSARENYSFYVDRSHRSGVKIFAPHGGCIEPCTEPLALALAIDMLDYFVFSGKRRKNCFKVLHVTSTHYDEPQCAQLAREAEVALALHGCDGEQNFIHVGGGNASLTSNLRDYLIDFGYSALPASRSLGGKDKRNFINLARRGGVQLELSAGFRRILFPGFPRSIQRHPVEFPKFVGRMRSWISELEKALLSNELS